nr:hypothetical protein [Planococcus glaciei]
MQAHYFIGIKIPEPAAKKLDQARTAWNLKSHKRYTHWVDMHITLLFYRQRSARRNTGGAAGTF